MRDRSSKDQSFEPKQLAKRIVDDATDSDEAKPTIKPPEKNPAAVELGRLGGLKGGPARAASLTKQERQEIARKAAEKRWKK